MLQIYKEKLKHHNMQVNLLDLETLGFRPIMPKKILDNGLNMGLMCM